MLNISLAMGRFSYKIGRNAQWEQLFSMYFDDFFYHLPYFIVQKSIFDDKMIFQWEHHILSIWDVMPFDQDRIV